MEETRVRHLARIAAAAAVGRRDALRGHFRAALADVPLRDLQEAALQVFLFAGYPRGITALEALAEAAGGEAPPTEPPADFTARGEEVFKAVYGPHAAAVKRKLSALHPDFARFVIRDAYGQVLGRPFLGLMEREAMAVAMLAALDQDAQLRAHVKGALRVGVPEPLVQIALAAGRSSYGA